MNDKKQSRIRRALALALRCVRLAQVVCVQSYSAPYYAQVIDADGDKVLAAASTLEKDLRSGKTGNRDAATVLVN